MDQENNRTTKNNPGRPRTRSKDDIQKLVDTQLPTANGDELKRLMSGDGRKAAEDDLPNLLTVTFQGAVSSQSVKRVCVWIATSKKFG